MRVKTLNMELSEIQSHFSKDIPQEWLERVDEVCRPHHIWLMRGGEAYCDYCGSKFSTNCLKEKVHNKRDTCPCCTKNFIVRKAWVGQNSAKRNALSYHFAKSKVNPDIITCTAIFSCYGYETCEAPWRTKPLRLIDALYVFVPGKGVAYASPWKLYPYDIRVEDGCYFYRTINSTLMYKHAMCFAVRRSFSARDCVYDNVWKESQAVYSHDDYESLYDAVQNTPLGYTVEAFRNALDDALAISPYRRPLVEMMERLARYPRQFEIVAKMGFSDAIAEIFYNKYSSNHLINLRGNNVAQIFKGQLTKEDKRFFFEKGATYCLLDMWQKLRRMGQPIPAEALSKICNEPYLMTVIDIAAKYSIKIKKIMSYIAKQQKLCKEQRPFMTYADYIRDCENLAENYNMGHIYNLSNKAILFPQNLVQAHQATIELINMERDRRAMLDFEKRKDKMAKELSGIEKKYKKLLPKLKKKYSYQADGYAIVIPPNLVDLHREGIDMHNCVGGYKKRVADGSTQVVYIRKLDDMDKSFGTMEISTRETIIQARGKYNKYLPEDADAFVKKFEHEVLEPLRTIASSLDRIA